MNVIFIKITGLNYIT